MNEERRAFLRWGIGLVLVQPPRLREPSSAEQVPTPAQGSAPGQEPRLGGTGESGTLGDPSVVGRPRTPTTAADNDVEIKAIEQKLACTCGCTLDIYTCRTTDFTCTYSPALHREVVALRDEGKEPQEIIDTFVARYGEKALMAPKPEGFNLAGYLVPGVVIATGATVLAWIIGRRRALAASVAGGSVEEPGAVQTASSASTTAATPEEWERLRRAVAESDD